MTKKTKEEYVCDWCGKPAAVFWKYEILCEHCWKWIMLKEGKEI